MNRPSVNPIVLAIHIDGPVPGSVHDLELYKKSNLNNNLLAERFKSRVNRDCN